MTRVEGRPCGSIAGSAPLDPIVHEIIGEVHIHSFRQTLLLAVLSFGLSATTVAQVTICDGDSTSVCTSIVVANATNVAADAEEVDPISNDPLGEPTITNKGGNAYQICVEITNAGGDLSGPNGEVQNGVGEGDCIEVQLEVFITIQTTITIGPITVSSATVRTSTTAPVQVCPC